MNQILLLELAQEIHSSYSPNPSKIQDHWLLDNMSCAVSVAPPSSLSVTDRSTYCLILDLTIIGALLRNVAWPITLRLVS
jgi:hypothetical protein